MAGAAHKPNVLIFGGLNTCSRALAGLLVPPDGPELVSHLRIVDKYSVDPPTTYIGAEFPKILEHPRVEYRQVNLTISSNIPSTFAPPQGETEFDYVFDFTGEVGHDRTDMIQFSTTCNVARMLGLEAAKRKVKAYIRIQHPFYVTSSKSGEDDKHSRKPVGTLGIWWHEALRSLAAIEDLNLVILQLGFIYGPYTNFGIIPTVITVASVYGFLRKPMKSLWSPGKQPNNTVHVDDVAGCAWACAQWISVHGRKSANALAGEPIPFHNDKSRMKGLEGVVPYDHKPITPIFYLVDDSNTTLLSIGQTTTSFFGTTFEFFNMLESTLHKDSVEDINEHHVGGWTEMILKSNPPIPNTPLTAYMDKYILDKHVVAFSNKKVKDILGYTLKKPQFNHMNIKEVIDNWKAEGSWPILD